MTVTIQVGFAQTAAASMQLYARLYKIFLILDDRLTKIFLRIIGYMGGSRRIQNTYRHGLWEQLAPREA